MAEPILQLDTISFQRNQHQILNGISWTVEAGQHWGILGANGAGKTTLLRILTGYEWPTSGCVTVLGKPFGHYDLRILRRLIGWVSNHLEHQIPDRETSLNVVLSGLDASIGLYRQFTTEERTRAIVALKQLGCHRLAGQSYGTLSQGERQKILIARAWVNLPRLIILDEPCAGLDPASRKHFLDELGRLSTLPETPTFLFVTHHIDELGPWINNVLALESGRVIGNGPKNQVLTTETMSRTFGCPCDVTCQNGHFHLTIQ